MPETFPVRGCLRDVPGRSPYGGCPTSGERSCTGLLTVNGGSRPIHPGLLADRPSVRIRPKCQEKQPRCGLVSARGPLQPGHLRTGRPFESGPNGQEKQPRCSLVPSTGSIRYRPSWRASRRRSSMAASSGSNRRSPSSPTLRCMLPRGSRVALVMDVPRTGLLTGRSPTFPVRGCLRCDVPRTGLLTVNGGPPRVILRDRTARRRISSLWCTLPTLRCPQANTGLSRATEFHPMPCSSSVYTSSIDGRCLALWW
jgi:hypothetical protein